MESESKAPFAQQAAKGSWASFIVVVLMLGIGRSSGSAAILDMAGIILAVMGIMAGIIALCGIRKHGVKKILAPALVGIVLNGFLVFIWVVNFMRAYTAARHG